MIQWRSCGHERAARAKEKFMSVSKLTGKSLNMGKPNPNAGNAKK